MYIYTNANLHGVLLWERVTGAQQTWALPACPAVGVELQMGFAYIP